MDYERLERALLSATEVFIHGLLQEVGPDDLKAVGLYTNGELSYFSPTANTRAWAESGERSVWSPPDWSHHLFADDAFGAVEAELLQGWSEDFSAFEIDTGRARHVVHDVLLMVRERHLSDSRVVVGLFMGGMGHPWVSRSVRAVNPESVWRGFEAEIGQQE